MHWFVTGGTGHIGHKLVRLLVRNGETVSALTSSSAQARTLNAQGAEGILGEMDRPESWKRVVAEADAIVHLAQKHARRFGSRQLAGIRKADEVCLRALMENAGGRCQALVYTSGALIYGNCPDPIREEDSFKCPEAIRAKLDHEALAQQLGREKGIRVVSARLGQVYGDGPGFFQEYYLNPGGQGKTIRYLGDGSNTFSYVHNDDVAEAYVHLVQSSKLEGPVNVGSVEHNTGRWMAEEVSRNFSAKSPKPLPALAVRLAMGWAFGGLVLQEHRMSSARLVSDGFVHRYPRTADGVRAACEAWKDSRSGQN